MAIPIPCGKCKGCLKDYVQSWSDRCTFESQTIGAPSAFVTLTYNDEHLPKDKSVHASECSDFNKRLRRNFDYYSKERRKIKMFWTSEYGSEDFRPHYHYLIFGFDPQSSLDMHCLDKAWSLKKESLGFFTADYLTPARIRYSMKYVNKEFNVDYYEDLEKRRLAPLFHSCSNGIGFDWFMQHIDHIIKHQGYVVNGKVRPLNRYYADLFRLIDDSKSLYKVYEPLQQRLKDSGIDWKLSTSLPSLIGELPFKNFEREKLMKHKELLYET